MRTTPMRGPDDARPAGASAKTRALETVELQHPPVPDYAMPSPMELTPLQRRVGNAGSIVFSGSWHPRSVSIKGGCRG